MPNIPLTDALGFDVDGKLAAGAKLLQVLPVFPKIKDTPLDQIPLSQANAGLVFSEPLPVQAANISLTVGAGAKGNLAILGPNQRALDEDDPFSIIAIADNERYVALGLDFSINSAVSVLAGSATFGFSADSELTIKAYRRFERNANGFPAFGDAFKTALGSFLLPRSAGDLTKLDADTVLVIAGNGELSVNGGFTMSTPVQPLASSPAVAGKQVDVNGSASFGATAAITIAGGYQVRLRRLAPSGSIEIGIYSLHSRKFQLTVTAQAGVTATVGTFDLAEKFISAISRNPTVDLAEFRQALPGEDPAAREQQIEGFQASLDAAIYTDISASVSASFSNLHANEAAWVFEVSLPALSANPAAGAVASALRGDFRPLTGPPGTLPAGITQTSNYLTTTDAGKRKLNVNLLGIVNFLSVAKITRMSTIERNAAGDITLITDSSSANRLQALLVNANNDTKRLRRMLSENFLIEAAYHAAPVGVLPPDFRAKHTFFEIHDQTGRDAMKDSLDVARVLGLITRDDQNRRLGTSDQFGRTTLYAQTRYTSDDVKRLFLTASGAARTVEDYETVGRNALGALLSGDANPGFRGRITDLGEAGNDLWNRMKQTGNVNAFGPLFGQDLGAVDASVEAAASDYLAITGWAKAMNQAAQAIVEVTRIVGAGGVSATDAGLTQAREQLKKRLAGAVANSNEHFGDPLGLIMVYLATGESAEKRVIATGPSIETLAAGA